MSNITPVAQIESLARAPLDPQVLSVRKTVQRLQIEMLVPADLAYFQGHFPTQPILPGVAQILWVARFVQRWLAPSMIFQHMDRVKFKSLIYPGDELMLDVRCIPTGVSYQYLRAGRVVGSGYLISGSDETSA
ncbi:MAG: hypothetical protein O3A63_12195 [Proteobacteria bacterium]|nr:hypothetical protein [Pseudomonadota bacterium]